jgi:hypothetical protein
MDEESPAALRDLESHLRLELQDSARDSRTLEIAVGAARRCHSVLDRTKRTAGYRIVGVAEIRMIEDVISICPNCECERFAANREGFLDREVSIEITRPIICQLA